MTLAFMGGGLWWAPRESPSRVDAAQGPRVCARLCPIRLSVSLVLPVHLMGETCALPQLLNEEASVGSLRKG